MLHFYIFWRKKSVTCVVLTQLGVIHYGEVICASECVAIAQNSLFVMIYDPTQHWIALWQEIQRIKGIGVKILTKTYIYLFEMCCVEMCRWVHTGDKAIWNKIILTLIVWPTNNLGLHFTPGTKQPTRMMVQVPFPVQPILVVFVVIFDLFGF